MFKMIMTGLVFSSLATWASFSVQFLSAEVAVPVAAWSLDSMDGGAVSDSAGSHDATVSGDPDIVSGAVSNSLAFDGEADCLSVADAADLSFSNATFSLSAWVNVYILDYSQQMIIAKNNYAAKSREWSLMIDDDNCFALYLREGSSWHSLGSLTSPVPGEWCHIAVTCDAGYVRIYVNGALDSEEQLVASLEETDAHVTIGASVSGGVLSQQFYGALDAVQVFDTVLGASAIAELVDIPEPESHVLPVEDLPVQEPASVLLWSLPAADAIPSLSNVVFHAIKEYEPDTDGYEFLHGVGLAWHGDKLYASFGHNESYENSVGEVAHYRVSEDGGATWGEVQTIAGSVGTLSVSHGCFYSTTNGLWGFQGAFYDTRERTHCRAYLLNEVSGAWEPQGIVAGEGFWPLQEPVRMNNGNWIMAGLRVCRGYTEEGMDGGFLNLPAVAISQGADFTQWDMKVIPILDGLADPWGESNVIVNGTHITLVARWTGSSPYVLISESSDSGETWSDLKPGNLPMAASKPCAGVLSTGQRYLIANSAGDIGNARAPLTIAYSLPGETGLTQLRVIRRAVQSDAPWDGSRLSYPCAVEKDGYLYVGYSNDAYRGSNLNNAELAVFPISELE